MFAPVNFTNSAHAATTRTNLGLGWSALTNSNSATSLLGFTTNGQVVADTGTNVLTFTNTVRISGGQAFFPDGTTNFVGIAIGATNTGLAYGGIIQGNLGLVDGGKLMAIMDNITGVRFYGPLTFNSDVEQTRTNLGLGATWLTNANVTNFRTAIELGQTNSVTFQKLLLNGTTSASFPFSIGEKRTQGTNERFYGFSWDGQYNGNLTYHHDVTSISSEPEVRIGSAQITVYSPITFASGSAETRTNLGLGWPALTNTNAGTSLVSVNTNGDVVSPTNFWQRAPIQTLVQDLTVVVSSQTNNANSARNLYVYSLATNVSGISNTIILPTNAATFAGDEVTVIHRGNTNTTTVIRQDGSTNNLITLSNFDEAVKFIRESGQWDFYHNISYVEPIQFSGTNASNNAAISRTNLGLGSTNTVNFGIVSVPANGTNTVEVNIGSQGIEFNGDKTNGLISFIGTNLASTFRSDIGLPLAALTNTNAAGFQQAIFTTNAAPTNAGNFGSHAAWMGVNIVTNGVTNTFLIPLYK
jgi:hypothetical protein